ncbi:MAG: ADP-ribosylglycohydrolase family protein [Sphaerochaetaceae bacterium]|nr:ADP-ribosylglycohydrolase family protein [Sphaerochaetaceae bacterium]
MREGFITTILEAFAVGDAMGMPTEFMTRKQIAKDLGMVWELLPSTKSLNHSDLPSGSITDDTEQNLYLLRAYCKAGEVTLEQTVAALLAWIDETDAIAKKYIGPSSLQALKAIEAGESPTETGRKGTTCGGLMRSLAPTLISYASGYEPAELVAAVTTCLQPTHYTSQALEAACAYAFALFSALDGNPLEAIVVAALQGAKRGLQAAPYQACAASSGSRISYLLDHIQKFASDDELLDFLFAVYGTGLASADVCGAVFGIFLCAEKDVFKAISLAASVGGDTDTIAALVGALCTAYAGNHNIPSAIVEKVRAVNNLDFLILETEIREICSRNAR